MSQTPRLLILSFVAAGTVLAGCQPWHARQGFDDRAAMQTPQGQARLVEIASQGGPDGERAAQELHRQGAPPEVLRPALTTMIRYYSRGCIYEQERFDFENTELVLYEEACNELVELAVAFGEESIPALEAINPYGATRALSALGPRGAAGTPRAIAALGSPHAVIRAQAVDALQNIAPPDPPVLQALEELQESDPDEAVREAARRAHLVLIASEGRTAHVQAPVESAQEAPTPLERVVQPRPNDIALVIGIEDYRGTIPPSTAARRDAQVFADLAETHLGLSRRNIIVLIDQQATRSSLEAYLEDWLVKNARADGRVYVYFAGHGAPDPQTGEGYLVPWDGDPRFIDRQGIKIDTLTAQLQELPAAEVILMMDSCFSGSGGRSVLAEGTRPLVPVQAFDARRDDSDAGETRFTLFAAAQSDEVTGMTPDGQHGLFSYYLFQGLRGEADRNGDGRVSNGELADFIAGTVPDEARRDNRSQTPFTQFLPEAAADADLVVFD